MSIRPYHSFVATLLVIALIVPTFFLAPRTAHADLWAAEVPTADFITQIKSAITSVATYANYVNTYVLQPLAFVMSVGLVKAMTAGVLAFVVGKSNGTGKTQFTQDVQGTLQKVGDLQANAFFLQFGRNSNSPFAASITSSLRTNYLQQTSMAGFWAANRCTLSGASPNVNAFLAGKWSQGGTRAWLSLTTQPQNNPYTLYQTSNSQLASAVSSAQTTRDKVLSWGQGFMSWCGATDTSGNATPADPGAGADGTACDFSDAGSQDGTWKGGHCLSNGTTGSAAIDPGDPCTTKDGLPGTLKTPGTTIKATLDKVLGSTQDKLIQMGSLAKEVNGVMKDVATIVQTAEFAKSLLGGIGSGGLAGVGATSAGNTSSTLTTYNRSAFLGVTTDTVYQNAAAIQATSADAATTRVNQFETAWATIAVSAHAAAGALTDLSAACSSEAGVAQTALTSLVNPVFAQATQASTTIATARAFIAKVTSEQNLTTDAGKAAYSEDLQTLQNLSPNDSDVLNIQGGARASGAARASPSGSLNVSGGSLVDQMNLLSSNAASRKSVCTYIPPVFEPTGGA